jgi:predicted DsbA family dithiol-disulfide isomerase
VFPERESEARRLRLPRTESAEETPGIVPLQCAQCKEAETAIQGKEVEVEWMPFELRPYPHERLRPEGEYLQRAWANSVYPLAQRMGVPIALPKISPQPYTHLPFEGYQYAKEHGKGNDYNDRVLKAFFVEGQDIGQIDVLGKLAGEVGLNQQKFEDAVRSRKYQEAHKQALRHAYQEAGIQAVPTFVIGGTKLSGMQSKENLQAVIDEETKAASTHADH